MLVNPRRACAVRLQYLVGLSVYVCLSTLSTGNEAAYERYQRLQNCASLKTTINPKTIAFERYAVKTANMHNHAGLPRPDLLALCTSETQKVTTKSVYRLMHSIYQCRSPVSYPRAGNA